MNRREALKLFGRAALLATPFSSRILHGLTLEKRWILIRDSSTPPSRDPESLLERCSVFLSPRNPNWTRAVVTWDKRVHAKEIRTFVAKYGRNTSDIEYPVLISVPDSRSEALEVETWTWRSLTAAERFQDSCYPVSGGWWSVDGDWNPSLRKVHDHLYQSPNHTGGHFQAGWLDLLKFEELQSLHSDHHREMEGDGRVIWKNVNAECPATCLPAPMAFAGPDRTIQLGQSTVLGGMALASHVYRWTPANSLDDASSSSPTATPTKNTTYTLEVETPCGKATQKVMVTVSI